MSDSKAPIVATVVSIYNGKIGPEHKPGLHPSWYEVPAAVNPHDPENGKLGLLGVSDGTHYIPMLDYQVMAVTVPGTDIARAIAEDWKSAQVMANQDGWPGVFHVAGEHDDESIRENFSDLLETQFTTHKNWCRKLVKMADDLWSVSKQHRHIATTMVNAANFLQVEREWAKEWNPVQTMKCIACFSVLEYGTIICKHCGVVLDKERFDELELVRK